MGSIFSKSSSEKHGSSHEASAPASRTGSLLRVTLKRNGSRTGTLTKKGSKKYQKSEDASKEHSPQSTSVTAGSETAKDLQTIGQKQPKTPEMQRQGGDTSLQEDWENLTNSTAGIEAAAPVAIPESDADTGILTPPPKVKAVAEEPVSATVPHQAECDSQQKLPEATELAVESRTAIEEFVENSISEATTRNENEEVVSDEKTQPIVEAECAMEVAPEAEVKPVTEEAGLAQHEDEFVVLQQTSQEAEGSVSEEHVAGTETISPEVQTDVPHAKETIDDSREEHCEPTISEEVPEVAHVEMPHNTSEPHEVHAEKSEVESTKELESEHIKPPPETTEAPADKEIEVEIAAQPPQPEAEPICCEAGSESLEQAPGDSGKESVSPCVADNITAEVELPGEHDHPSPLATDSTPVEAELPLEADHVPSQPEEEHSDIQPISEEQKESAIDETTMTTCIPDPPAEALMQTQELSEPEIILASEDPCEAPPATETAETQPAPDHMEVSPEAPAEDQSIAAEQQPTEVVGEENQELPADSCITESHQESETLDLAQTHEAPAEDQSIAVEQQPTEAAGDEPQEHPADSCTTESHQESETLELAQAHEMPVEDQSIAVEQRPTEVLGEENQELPVDSCTTESHQESETLDLALAHEVDVNLAGVDVTATEVAEPQLNDEEKKVELSPEETLDSEKQESESFHGDASAEPSKDEGQSSGEKEFEVIPEGTPVEQADESHPSTCDNGVLPDQTEDVSESAREKAVDNEGLTNHCLEKSQDAEKDIGSVHAEQPPPEFELKSAVGEHAASSEICPEGEKPSDADAQIGDEGNCVTTDAGQDHVADLKAAREGDLLPPEETNGFHETPAEVEAR
ncbi:hypothetical protein AAHC03_020901 [Spirometra sp. Aus1]